MLISLLKSYDEISLCPLAPIFAVSVRSGILNNIELLRKMQIN